MKTKFFLGLITLVVVVCTNTAATAGPTFQLGGELPSFELSVPTDEAHKEYLGLSGSGSFAVSDIDAEVVIIEIFSMYCPHCQREAPKINDLYRLIEENEQLRGKIKLIGVGAGNSDFEVNVFRQTYQVPFPLFADERFAIHKALGELRTPYFIGIKRKNGGHEIFYSKLGGFESPEVFLQSMVDRSGLKREGK